MKNGTLQLDEAMTAYLEHAAAIDGNTVKNFLSKLRRQFNALHPSVKRCTAQLFAEKTICDTGRSRD